MPKIRTIKPNFFMSDDIGEITVKSRLLYVALWCHADCHGYIKFQRTSLKVQTMPFEMDDFDDCLTELEQKEHLVFFDHPKGKFIFIPKFTEHQRPHHTEKPMGISIEDEGVTVTSPSVHGDVTVVHRKEKEVEGKGKGNGREVERNDQQACRSSPSERSPKSKSDSQAFDRWWSSYPNKQGKSDASKKFAKLSSDERESLMVATENYKQAVSGGVNGGIYAHGSTFINGRWLDWIDPDESVFVNGKTEISKSDRHSAKKNAFLESLRRRDGIAKGSTDTS